jgi:hypothetical protein
VTKAVCSDFGLQPDEWPKVLPVIQSVLINTPTSSKAGFSPMRVFTGHEATDPLALALNDNLVVPQSYTFVRAQQSAKAAELQTTMAKIHKDVGKASTRLRQKAIAAHNLKTHVRKANFRVGDYVLVAVPRKDRRHNLMATWRGPRRVVRLESHSILEVENLVKARARSCTALISNSTRSQTCCIRQSSSRK